MRPTSLRPASDLAETKPCGTRIRYMGGCRCLPCRAANSRYECDRAAKRRAGLTNRIVPAGPAQRHILRLSRLGVGRRVVARVTGIAETIIGGIKDGTRPHCRERTLRAILSVGVEAKAPGALVDAQPLTEMIDTLRRMGWTRGDIAQATGRKTRALQLRTRRIRRKSLDGIRDLYRTAPAKKYVGIAATEEGEAPDAIAS